MSAWLYPAQVLGAGALAWGLLDAGAGPETALVAATCWGVAGATLGERLWPFSASWSRSRGDVAHDAGHTLISLAVTQLVVGLASAAAAGLPGERAWWPGAWPWLAQVVVYLLIVELLAYWAHRALHRGALWRVHALHHSAERLYWLNASRVHPLDALVSASASLTWAVVVAVPVEVVVIASAITTAHLLMQHSNARTRTAWLAPVLATSEFHRWHHVRDAEAAQVNFGHVLGVWDVVFGTWRRGEPEPDLEVGTEEGAPQGFWQQLVRLGRHADASSEAVEP